MTDREIAIFAAFLAILIVYDHTLAATWRLTRDISIGTRHGASILVTIVVILLVFALLKLFEVAADYV